MMEKKLSVTSAPSLNASLTLLKQKIVRSEIVRLSVYSVETLLQVIHTNHAPLGGDFVAKCFVGYQNYPEGFFNHFNKNESTLYISHLI